MFELIIIALFSLILLYFVLMGYSVIYALLIGFLIFCFYGIKKGNTIFEISKMAYEGFLQMTNILKVFMLIGIITATWKSSGTIAYIIVKSSALITPELFIPVTFILCSILSMLIGTSFGTAATMGVICISMARAMGINDTIVAGAVLSGVFYGDRFSPMSTSALLVSEISGTNLFENLKLMFKTSIVPTILTLIFYYIIGLRAGSSSVDYKTINLLKDNFNLETVMILPALVIVVLSLFKVDVKKTMSVSIVCAILLSYFFQDLSAGQILKFSIFGYESTNEHINALFKGGGMVSMINVSIIIMIASTYSGIFEGTGLLENIKSAIYKLSERTFDFFAVLVTGIITSMIACNQSLATVLNYRLCKGITDDQKLAIFIENSSILISGMIPWSIASAVPLSTLKADKSAILFAFYLYILPLYTLLVEYINSKKTTD
ncbi:NA+/H+ antiporter NHAC [Peptoniphilus sp. ING2-D1G]|nr:NA+/H+ antiporter NHAC [Peptoniphilus sp. ING2-D1G]